MMKNSSFKKELPFSAGASERQFIMYKTYLLLKLKRVFCLNLYLPKNQYCVNKEKKIVEKLSVL